MIESASVDGVTVLTLKHGKANALDLEVCDALTGRFLALRLAESKAVVLTQQAVLQRSRIGAAITAMMTMPTSPMPMSIMAPIATSVAVSPSQDGVSG